jgi:outer membrane receptor protein involved in Fe transport
MKLLSARAFLRVMMVLAFSVTLLAQETGSLDGLVVDAETGEELLGVNVMLQGTTLGAATDLDGHYRILNVPVGSYTLAGTYIGYAKFTVNAVEVKAGSATTVNMKLNSEALELGEVVIEAKEINNTEASLLSIQKRSAGVSDGISSEQIKKSPDADAGDAVKRVSGVTVIGDKNVVVRGLGERYNNARLNGASIASPEPLKRTVPFDVIPANLLDNIVVSKTFSPDQPGDFAGGSVNLTTKEFPEKLLLSASVSSSYNDQSSLKEFMTYQGGNRDWLGMDDGTRAIPDRVEEVTAQYQGWINDEPVRRSLAKEFKNVWEPVGSSAPLNGSRSFSFGNTSSLGGRPLGYLLAFNYGSSFSRRTEKQYYYTSAFDEASGTTSLDTTANLSVDRSVRAVGLGGIFDLNHKLSDRHKISLKSMYTRSADDEVKSFEGTIDDDTQYRNYHLAWTERALFTLQPKGAHEFPSLLDSRLEWTYAYSRGAFDQPDRRDVYYNYSDVDSDWVFLGTSDSGFRRFAKMRDDVHEFNFDWSVPFKFRSLPGSKLKFGALARSQDRTFPTRKFYLNSARVPGAPAYDATLDPEQIFSPHYIDNYFHLAEISGTLDSYNADMQTQAGFLMADMLINKHWRATYGARIENTKQHFKTFPPIAGGALDVTEGGPEHTDVLPALALTYKLNDKSNLRFAASKTVANPDYQELVPAEDSDYFEGTVKRGNPDLRYTKIANFDLRTEYYPRPWETLSFGVFYKRITDPIEWFLAPGFAGGEVSLPGNLVDANNLGAELEFRKQFDFLEKSLGSWAARFSALGNFTYVSSTVDLNVDKYKPGQQLTGETVLTNDNRPMMGQSDYVVNLALGYDDLKRGTSARLLFNTFGERISQVGAYGVPDTYEQPFSKLDASVNQKVSANWSAKFNATNLLDSDVEFLTGESTFINYRVGRTFALGLTYSL